MMKVHVVGVERSKGTSAKSGKEYDMATLHVITKLAERADENSLSKGFMGDSYRVSPDLVRKVEHLGFPFVAEMSVEDVMRFGKRESNVVELVPVERAPVEPQRKAA